MFFVNVIQSIFDILYMDIFLQSRDQFNINYTDLVFMLSDDSLCNNENGGLEFEDGFSVNTEDVFLEDNVQNYVNVESDK